MERSLAVGAVQILKCPSRTQTLPLDGRILLERFSSGDFQTNTVQKFHIHTGVFPPKSMNFCKISLYTRAVPVNFTKLASNFRGS